MKGRKQKQTKTTKGRQAQIYQIRESAPQKKEKENWKELEEESVPKLDLDVPSISAAIQGNDTLLSTFDVAPATSTGDVHQTQAIMKIYIYWKILLMKLKYLKNIPDLLI